MHWQAQLKDVRLICFLKHFVCFHLSSNMEKLTKNGEKLDSLHQICDWTSAPEVEKHSEFFARLLQMVLEQAVFEGTSRESKVRHEKQYQRGIFLFSIF